MKNDLIGQFSETEPGGLGEIGFQMDARDMALALRDLRGNELELLGFFHSRTTPSLGRPSQADIANHMEFIERAKKLNLSIPLLLVVSLEDRSQPIVRTFRIEQFRAKEVTLITI